MIGDSFDEQLFDLGEHVLAAFGRGDYVLKSLATQEIIRKLGTCCRYVGSGDMSCTRLVGRAAPFNSAIRSHTIYTAGMHAQPLATP